MLPHETAVETELAIRFPYLFQTAHDVHVLAVKPLLEPDGIVGKISRGLSRSVVYTAIGLHVKALKQHRSTQVLAEKGLGQDALAITRNLFETMMALAFLLRHRVTLKEHGRVLAPVPGKPLSTRFRTQMYDANTTLEKQRTNTEFARTKGLRNWAKSLNTPELLAEIKAVEAALGPDWTKRLRDRKSYSGVSIKDLAISLRLGPAYATHYRVSSWSVHASTLHRYITFDGQGGPPTIHLFPDASDVGEAVHTANIFLLACIDLLNSRMGLGLENGIKAMRMRLTTKKK